jgi:uncharacterized protein involved in exopolysaccharide biosynthesis
VQSPLVSALPRDKGKTNPADEFEVRDTEGREGTGGEGPARGLRARIRETLRRSTPEPRHRGSADAALAQAPHAQEPTAPTGNEFHYHEGPEPRDPEAWRPLIDPYKVIGGIANSRMLILSTTVLGALVGVAIALSTPKKYEAYAEMLVDPRDLALIDRELTTSGLPSDATLAIVENQVRVLTSGTVLNRVVDELNLTSDPEFNGSAGSGLMGLVSNWRSLLSRGGGGEDDGSRRRALTVDHLARSLNVERGGKTFVVSVSATTESPEKSALIANTMTSIFLETYGELQSNTAGRATDELTARLDELRKGVEEAERKVETFKAENDLIGAQGRLISEDEIVKLNEQLSLARARTIELNAKAATGRTATVDAALTGVLPEELTSNVMTELRSQYAALKSESDRLSTRLGPRHPQRLAVEAQLDGARDQIAQELRRIVSSNQVELRRAVQLEQDLAARLAQLKVGQGDTNADLVTLRELEREATAKRAVYESFLLRAKQTGEQADINTANISVISQAFPPIVPTGPSRAVISLAGLFLGFMAGVGLGGARGIAASLRDDAGRRRAAVDEPQPRPTGPGGSGGRSDGGDRDAGSEQRTSMESGGAARREPAAKEASMTGNWFGAFRRRSREDQPEQPGRMQPMASQGWSPPMQYLPAAAMPPQFAQPMQPPQAYAAQPLHYQQYQPMPVQDGYAAQVYTQQAYAPQQQVDPRQQGYQHPGQQAAYAQPHPVHRALEQVAAYRAQAAAQQQPGQPQQSFQPPESHQPQQYYQPQQFYAQHQPQLHQPQPGQYYPQPHQAPVYGHQQPHPVAPQMPYQNGYAATPRPDVGYDGTPPPGPSYRDEPSDAPRGYAGGMGEDRDRTYRSYDPPVRYGRDEPRHRDERHNDSRYRDEGYAEAELSRDTIDEIREELREFRDAVRDFTEERARRRYS